MSKLPIHRCGETWSAFSVRFMADPVAIDTYPDPDDREKACEAAWRTRYAPAPAVATPNKTKTPTKRKTAK
jgi:hypothetical protein